MPVKIDLKTKTTRFFINFYLYTMFILFYINKIFPHFNLKKIEKIIQN